MTAPGRSAGPPVDGLVVGVDGGGSSCRAVLVDGSGAVLGRASGGPAVADGRSDGAAVREVERLTRALLGETGTDAPVSALWAGLAGAGRAGPRDGVEEGLRLRRLARRVGVGTDVGAAFHAAFGDGPGLLLVAGTGSVARGRGPGGREGRAGGWGPVLGDEGSGFALGLAGVQAVVRAEDGRGPPTGLRERLAVEAGLADRDAPPERGGGDPPLGHRVLEWVQAASRDRIARLAPLVAEAAGEGDAVAARLVEEAVRELIAHVTALAESLGPWPDPPDVSLAGGLLAPGRPLHRRVHEALATAGFHVLPTPPDAALGAAALARRLLEEGRS